MASVLCTRGENGIRAGFRFQYHFGMWVRVPSGALYSSNFFTSYNEGKPFEIFYKIQEATKMKKIVVFIISAIVAACATLGALEVTSAWAEEAPVNCIVEQQYF